MDDSRPEPGLSYCKGRADSSIWLLELTSGFLQSETEIKGGGEEAFPGIYSSTLGYCGAGGQPVTLYVPRPQAPLFGRHSLL